MNVDSHMAGGGIACDAVVGAAANGTESVKVSFVLTIGDIMALCSHNYRTNRRAIRTRRIFRFGSVAVLACLALFTDILEIRICCGIFILLWLTVVPWWSRRAYLRNAYKTFLRAENQRFFDRLTVTFGAESVKAESSFGDQTLQWKTFTHWTELPGYIFLYPDGVNACVIPCQQLSAEEVDRIRTILAAHVAKM